ncbi:Upstream of flc [Heracleum sosnowskyi]|uniref:Upstream of flc n=1 Tax=Heracleum sosnowskyi TaxID=360622 RepID=A0AAD8H0M2_9APIA|nr:Upstream of flc [Heracleum sosnowskyi]
MELRTSNSILGRSTSNSAIEVLYRDTSTKSSVTTSPERTKVWTQPPSKHHSNKVPVVYYLSRNAQLQHPHFIEVPLSSSSTGLYLRDVISRLNDLRGKSMATMYSWSSKRSYKNGYVWNDLAENDFIYPTHGNEYILKGSELLEPSKPDESVNSTSKQLEITKSADDSDDSPVIIRRRNQSWSSIDLQEYKVVYKAESSGELSSQGANASTQTEEKRRRRKTKHEKTESTRDPTELSRETTESTREITELTRDEFSPPGSESSTETLENLMKGEGKMIKSCGGRDDLTANNQSSGRMKASTVLMQLLTCGSISFKNYEEHPGLSLVTSQYKNSLPRGGDGNQVDKGTGENSVGKKNKGLFGSLGRGKVKVTEDREYFSGSLVDETNKVEVPGLKRSSSYNADRRG